MASRFSFHHSVVNPNISSPIRGVRTFLSAFFHKINISCPARLYALVGFLCFVVFAPGLLFAQTEVDGEVSGVWTVEGSPYIILEGAVVPSNEKLRIQPGVTVIVRDLFTINGLILAEGTEEDSIIFQYDEENGNNPFALLYIRDLRENQEVD